MAQSTMIRKRSTLSTPVAVKISAWKQARREMRPRLAYQICKPCDGAGCERCWGEGTVPVVRA